MMVNGNGCCRLLEERDVREVHYEKRTIPKHNNDQHAQLERNRQKLVVMDTFLVIQ